MDIPVFAMIQRSGWVARLVLLVLAVFSVITWSIVLDRLLAYASVKRLHKRIRLVLENGARIADIESLDKRVQRTPMGMIAVAAAAEYKRILADAADNQRVRDWSFFLGSQFEMARDQLSSVVTDGLGRMERGLVLLAVMSSAAPLLGLFGTVWGVMNSFFQIGNSGAASLPVVAPGIAEALITTVIGLAVAIPALLFYNVFAHRTERFEDELGAAKETMLLRVKRDVLEQFYGKGV